MFNQDAIETHKLVYPAILLLCACVLLITLIANPGYYSHDELQRYDFYVQHGFWEYFDRHSRILGTTDFAMPVRPIPFYVQGLQNLVLRDYPYIVHLSSVLVHTCSAYLLFLIAMSLGSSRNTSFVAAIIFIFNPLSILATGWSAALMDQWYVLFALLGFWHSQRYLADSTASAGHLISVFLFTVFAILSKETAVMLPGLYALLLIWKTSLWRSPRFWQILSVVSLPILTYIIIRFSSISSSMLAEGDSPYSVNLQHVAQNAFLYLSYPFHPLLSEIAAWVHTPVLSMIAAFSVHVALIAIIWRWFSFKIVFLYLALTFLFLIPVLPIPFTGSHYLYASAIPLSVAVATLLTHRLSASTSLFATVALVLLAIHSAYFQLFLYDNGRCMSRLQTSSESVYQSAGRPSTIEYRAAPGSREYLLRRFVFGRNQLGTYYPVNLLVINQTEQFSQDALSVTMNDECIAYINPPAASRVPVTLTVADWGPTSASMGELVNPQPDGTMGIWIRFNQAVMGQYQLYFDDAPALHTHAQESSVTASIDPALLTTPGQKSIHLRNVSSGERVEVGYFNLISMDQTKD
jgi:hypothetical protein